MSGGDANPSGPNLAHGIDSKDVADGAALVGHVSGEPVLVTRRGSDVFAIGATCTHYGGPLAKGLVVGDTVRCPLHHACFSLRTGEALCAPALNPVDSFDVEEREGKLFVLGKRRLRGSGAPSESPTSIVIAGAGGAGNAAAEMLRREGYAGPVTMVGADPAGPYDRPNLSKDYLAGNAPEEWIPLRPMEFYSERGIDLLLGTRVERVDIAAKSLSLSNGANLPYGALLLATGADPIRLAVPGAELPHVVYLRTLADSRDLISRSLGAKNAVVVGAGFIGLEVAASLRARGVGVAVVAPDAVPLGRVMGDAIGAEIRRIHEEHGVTFHMGAKPLSIDPRGVVLDSGTRLAADVVVVGVGVKPAVALAEASGLAVDRGILVDAYLRAGAPGVYAAGDVARFPDARTGDLIRVEHWVVAERQGQVAAQNILGRHRPFDVVPFFWSAHYDLTISYVGRGENWDRVDIAGSIRGHDCAVAFRRGGSTLALATIGRDEVSLKAEAAMELGDESALAKLVPRTLPEVT
jgi:3-phenylpropionate/trans-cinnamate dioxygenase ferredoxin reductase subunit